MTWFEQLLCRMLHDHECSEAKGYYFFRCTVPGCGLLRITLTPAERLRRLALNDATKHILKSWRALTGGDK